MSYPRWHSVLLTIVALDLCCGQAPTIPAIVSFAVTSGGADQVEHCIHNIMYGRVISIFISKYCFLGCMLPTIRRQCFPYISDWLTSSSARYQPAISCPGICANASHIISNEDENRRIFFAKYAIQLFLRCVAQE